MSRSLSTIALRWCLSRCAVATLLTAFACSPAWAQSGSPLVRTFPTAQRAPARVAQMPSQQAGPNGRQPTVIYDGMGPGPGGPSPAEAYPNNGHNGMNGNGYNNGYDGNCNCGPSGDCYGGGGGGCADGGCGGGCGGCSDGYCSGGCGCDWGGDCGDCYGGCYGGCDDAFCGMYCNHPRVSIYVDWLYLQATNADVTHAQQVDLDSDGSTPIGRVGSLDIGHDSGVRIGGSIGCDQCASLTWSFTNFESYNDERVHAPFLWDGDGGVASLVQHPAAEIGASDFSVDAAYDIDFRMADLMYRRFLTGGPNYAVNYSWGVQFGHLEQFFLQGGLFNNTLETPIVTYTNIDFDGGGIKAGLDAERQLCWGFLTYCRATAAIMTGRFSSNYTMVDPEDELLLTRVKWKDDRIVPQLEYEVGLGWTSPSGHWRFSTGYMLSYWANVVTTPEFINAVQNGNYVDVDGDLAFDGGVTRLELRW